MGIVEFGTANDHRGRGIVPKEERAKAERDAEDYGVGFLTREGRHIPSNIEVIFPEEAPQVLVDAFWEWISRRASRGTE